MAWVYQDDRGNDATLVVEGTTTVGNIECIVFKLDRLKSDQFDSKGRPESSREFCVVTDAGVLVYRMEGDRQENFADNPYPRIRFGTRKGDSWDWKHGKEVVKMENLGEEEIEVPAGKYRALKIRTLSPLMGAEMKSTEWFAKEVGLVKVQSEVLGYASGMSLKKIRPGP